MAYGLESLQEKKIILTEDAIWMSSILSFQAMFSNNLFFVC